MRIIGDLKDDTCTITFFQAGQRYIAQVEDGDVTVSVRFSHDEVAGFDQLKALTRDKILPEAKQWLAQLRKTRSNAVKSVTTQQDEGWTEII